MCVCATAKRRRREMKLDRRFKRRSPETAARRMARSQGGRRFTTRLLGNQLSSATSASGAAALAARTVGFAQVKIDDIA